MSRRERAAATAAGVLARTLLWLYPAPFRREAGAGLIRDVRRRAVERLGSGGALRFASWWLRTALSLLGNAAGAWTDRGLQAPRLRPILRGLVRSPGFTVAVVLILALGIGGTTAVFSAVRAVLLEPLPYPDSGALVRLYNTEPGEPDGREFVTAPHFLYYREHASAFESLATVYTYDETGVDLMVGDRPERVRTLRVSPSYFRVLRQAPMLGRTFAPGEERGEPLAVVSERLWRRLDPEARALGMGLDLDGVRHTVLGVVPAGFRDPITGDVQVWVPQNLHSNGAEYPGNHFLTVIARLADGVTPGRARSEMRALDRELGELYPDVADETAFALVPLRDDLVAGARPVLLLLLGAVGLVLAIGCVNVGNLLMVRAMGRTREVAVRVALGAARKRIAGELLAEGVVLATGGGLAGVALATVGVRTLASLGGHTLPPGVEVGVDGTVLGFAAAVSLATGLAFALAPALRASRAAPAATLRSSSAGAGGSAGALRLRGGLVAGQVALAFVLLMGASVLAVSVLRLSRVDLGVRSDHVLTFQLNLPVGRYDEVARSAFHRDLTGRLARLPGATAAGAASWLPATGSAYRWGVFPASGPLAGRADEEVGVGADQRVVAGDYFAVLGIPLLEGRLFDGRDEPDARTPSVVVGRSVADALFPGTSAIGQRVRVAGGERTVVGVVADVARDGEGDPARVVYHSQPQYGERNWAMSYLVRTRGDPREVTAAVRAAVAEVDPRLVVYHPTPLGDILGRGQERRRFALTLTAVFAVLALTLAALGLYGVLAHLVGQRRRELAIRLALGAGPARVAGIVLGHGLGMTLAGLVVGAAASLVLGRLVTSLVFRTEPADPRIMAAAATVLGVVALLATLVPAWRALRVPPRTTLAEG